MNPAIAEYGRVLRARWLWVVVVALVVVGAAAALLLVQPPTYASTSAVFVSTPRDDSDTYYRGDSYARERTPTYLALVQTEDMAARVADDVGNGTDTAAIAASTVATAVPDTVLIQLTTQWSTPALAQRINQSYVDELTAAVTALESIPGALNARAELLVVQTSTFDASPAGLSPILILGAVGAVGLFLGALLVVLTEVFDTRIRRPQDAVEASGSPLLAVLGAPGELDGNEPFRVLSRRLAGGNHASSSIVLVTPVENDAPRMGFGTRLARSLGEDGSRVAFVDFDIRSPGSVSTTQDHAVPSLADIVLDGADPIAVRSAADGFVTIVPTGDVPEGGAARMVDSARVAELFDALRAEFRWIVLVTSPAPDTSDAARLAEHSDTTLVLVAAGRTRFDALRNTTEELPVVDGIVYLTSHTGLDVPPDFDTNRRHGGTEEKRAHEIR